MDEQIDVKWLAFLIDILDTATQELKKLNEAVGSIQKGKCHSSSYLFLLFLLVDVYLIA